MKHSHAVLFGFVIGAIPWFVIALLMLLPPGFTFHSALISVGLLWILLTPIMGIGIASMVWLSLNSKD